MADLLSDLLNDRLQPVPLKGTVNGSIQFEVSDSEHEDFSDDFSESDTEQQEYVKKEFDSYFNDPQDTIDGLTDIVDGCEESLIGSELMELVTVPTVFGRYNFNNYYKKELPIDSFKTKILNMIKTNSVIIIHGPTGCGKTTQVPQYIIDSCKASNSPCNIVVTQPRRIAAINIAQRVCEERGWAIGTVCGYQVGLDKRVEDEVILTYVTTEVLLQKLISQKNLNKYTHIIIDEVHERNKSLDFLLLLVRKYMFTNSPSVKIVLMSATMEADDFAYYFRTISRNNPDNYLPAPILHVNKKSEYETNIYYIEQFAPSSLTKMEYPIDEPYISLQQYEMCLKLVKIFDELDEKEGSEGSATIGSVLVFLPGFHEIEEMNKILMGNKNDRNSGPSWEIIPLHSSLTSEHMGKVFHKPKAGTRKIILSTNIAESSVTVPDVKYVIDFCLTKIMTMNDVTKFSTLSLQWASRNNCMQRAGRVGRVSSGRVYRLVPCNFYDHQMQETTLPELQRAPLENVILYMKLLDLNDTPKNVLALALSPPNLKDVQTCIWKLKEVGALLPTCRGHQTPADGDITFVGRVMGSLPIDIRLSKLILLGHMFSCLEETVIMAAGAMTRNVFVQNFHDRFKCYRKKLLWADGSCSDFMILLNLYNVWLNAKRENVFRTPNEEYAWCKTNFVNLKGLREWDVLIREINNRLKRLGIEKPMGVDRVHLSPTEKPTILKVVICGAFYPNYFIRSSEYGQVDAREALKIVNGRDPNHTVYFTNMKCNQPGQIYVRQMKQLMQAENNKNVLIGFDEQSSKIFVEFKKVAQPEQVTVDGRQYITTIPGNISMDVYEAVRKRQLNVPFKLKILPDSKAWAFVHSTEEKLKVDKEEVNCFTEIAYSPLPSLDLGYITVSVTHIIDAGHFYCQNWNEETRRLLNRIFEALNKAEVFLDPLSTNDKVEVNDKMYAARFHEDGKYYRCKVVNITPGKPPVAQIQFTDYGNIQKVPTTFLCKLPDVSECKVDPIAMCCVLSEVQPHLVLNPKGLWSEKVNNIFRRRTQNVLLNAKVYSVVDDIVHLELFPLQPGPRTVSFNQYLINEGFGQKCEESQRSKMDHELRQKVLAAENPNSASNTYKPISTARNYTDFEEPSPSEFTEIVQLKGPFSPLEMKVCGLVQASVGVSVHVEGDSVNAVLLDDSPEDPHSRLLVAGTVSQSASGNCLKLLQTTVMPSVPGLPMIMTLLFCHQMEPKLTPDGSRVASILCGLGSREFSDKANFPMNDISLVLDTDLQGETIIKINQLRFYMNQAIKTMSAIYEEIAYPAELFTTQRELKDHLFSLLHMRQKSVDRVNVKYADVWSKSVIDNVEIMVINQEPDEDDIWPLLWFVNLNPEKRANMAINKNLDEMSQIAKRLVDEREIVCELCKSVVLRNVNEVRVHLFKQEHKRNLARFKGVN